MRLAKLMRSAALVAAALLAAAPAAAQNVAITLAPGEVLLKAEAEGVHLARPDLMNITAGVVTTGSTAKEALAANNALANRLLDAVRKSGVQPRDVVTEQLTVSPQFAEDRGGVDSDEERVRRITGYVARNRVGVTLRELGKAGEIINALFEAGANEVSGPTFGFSDPAPAERAARVAAVAAARNEADTYAAALGMKVSRVLRVSERGSFDVDEDAEFIVVTGSRIPVSPIEPGELATRIQVWVDYALVPR